MHRNSQLLFCTYGISRITADARVLEVGPDAFPSTLRKQVCEFQGQWDTIDLFASSKLTYQAESEYVFPIESETYDVVVASNVIEHVRNPFRWMREIVRVVKPGGHVIIVVPNNWIFHEAPIDCWRIYPDGMKQLFDESGLDVEQIVSKRLFVPSAQELVMTGFQSAFHSFKQTIKVMLGRDPDPYWTEWHALDTIAIGSRRP